MGRGRVADDRRVMGSLSLTPTMTSTAHSAHRTRVLLSPGIRYMAMGAFAFSVMSALVKLAGRRLPTQEVVLARGVLTMLFSWWGAHRAGARAFGHQPRLLVVRGIFGFIALSGFYYSLMHLPLADATVIQYANPVFAALLAVPLLGERLRAAEIVGVVACVAGVTLVARPTFLFASAAALDPVAVTAGVIGAIASAAAYVTVRKLGTGEHPLVIVFYFALVSTIGSAPFALADATWPTGTEWLVLLALGIATQAGQVNMTKGLQRERAGRATAVGYLQILFAGIWGILFFGERPGALTLIGAALIVGGTLAVAVEREA